MRKFPVLLLVLFLSLFAAAQNQPAADQQPAVKSAKATVFVYRYKQFVGSALAPSVYCDEVQLARMENGRYFAAMLDPGKHTFRSNDAQSGVELELKAGQNYFVRVEIATGFMKGHGRLILMSPEQGRYELTSSKLKTLDSGKVADASRVVVDEAQLTQALSAPAPAPTAVAAPQPKPAADAQPDAPRGQPLSPESSVTGVTLSDGSSQTGDQTSLADAARKAKLKKQTPDPAPANPNQ